MNRTLFRKLAKLHIITPIGIYCLVKCFAQDGISLMALLRFAAYHYPNRCALVTDGERLSYQDVFECANRLTKILFTEYGLKSGTCVGVLCRNHLIGTLLLPALSRLGVKIKLISTDIAPNKVNDLVRHNKIKSLVYDAELNGMRIPSDLSCEMIETAELLRQLSDKGRNDDVSLPHVKRGGELSVFTGGTSGRYKEAPRQMSVFQFLPPFFALLQDLHIDEFESVFLPLPMYHGFGLSTLIISLLMGKKICLVRHFDADEALKIISEEKIEVLPIVPAMLARLWQACNAPVLMKTVRCIISGGDRLDRKWIDETTEHLGSVMYNLYGTSEAGFFMLASPEDLLRHQEVTIGKPIRGVKCKVVHSDNEGTGSLWVRSSWAMISMKNKWQNTGDLVSCDADGFYFYRGRADHMVVCGGENVYPEVVESIINGHPDVLASMVYPVPDSRFGTVLNAKVELAPHSTLTTEEIKSWLRSRLSHAEMPHHISIEPINTLETGKRTQP